MLENGEIRQRFLQAANILDPDWMAKVSGPYGDENRNISTLNFTVLDSFLHRSSFYLPCIGMHTKPFV